MRDDLRPPRDDVMAPVSASRRLRRNYLALLAPVALVVAVAAFGALGRKADAVRSPLPSASFGPTRSSAATAPAASLPYLALELGPDVTSDRPAAAGRRLFYAAGTKTLMSLALRSGARPEPLLTVGQCEGLGEIAAAGSTLVYVVAKAAAPPASGTCGEPTRIAWTIYALDLQSGDARMLARGERADSATTSAYPPVHVALSADAFAFERPADAPVGKRPLHPLPAPADGSPAAPLETIEVHALRDGSLLWQTSVAGPVSRLVLGGERLAIQTDVPSRRLLVAARSHPAPALAARPSSGSDLSRDGRYLVWDTPDPSAGTGRLTVVQRDLETGADRVVGLDSGPPSPEIFEPVVGATADGPEVAWFTTLDDGGLHPAFVDPTHPDGAAIPSRGEPVWMSIQGDDLVWIAKDGGDQPSIAYVADLPTARAGLRPLP